jgi:hypothetical protein
MSWLYRPNHPLADEFGMVEKHMVMPAESKPGLYVISDTMPHMKHPGTGRMLDSKAEFRRDTRASGCVEVGTDPGIRQEKPRPTVSTAEYVQDVKRAIQELNSR